MTKHEKLNSGDKHMLNLVARDAGASGWTAVSAVVAPLLEKIPGGFVECIPDGDKYKARLTDAGTNLIDAMAWL